MAGRVVIHLAPQAGVSPDAHADDEWSERTQRYYRAQIRAHCGFRAFRAADEAPFVAWLSSRVTAPNPQSEALQATAYDHLRTQRIGPPLTERWHRLLAAAVRPRERGLVKDTAAQMSLPLSISSLPCAL